ncbi:hypothetical protein [Methylobacterium sp. CM6257]
MRSTPLVSCSHDGITGLVSRTARAPTPFTGWALVRVIELDRDCPGLLAATFCFGAQRRQAVFLVLAAIEALGTEEIARRFRRSEFAPEFRDPESAAVVGHALLALRRPRNLVQAVFGAPPDGLLGTLGRLGSAPIGEPPAYLELVRLFCSGDPADRRRAKVLGQISGNLLGAQIAVVSVLDPLLLHPALVSTIYEVEQVAVLQQALAYVRARCTGATDDAIRASLGQIKPGSHRGELIKAWAARFDKVPCTLDTRGDPTLIVLDSGAALADAGRRYGNCLADKINEVILGSYLFVEYRPAATGEPGVIAELRRTTKGWLLENLYAANNCVVRTERAQVVREKLATCGVALLAHAPADREAVLATARLLGADSLLTPDEAGWVTEIVEVDDDLRPVLG